MVWGILFVFFMGFFHGLLLHVSALAKHASGKWES